MTKKNSRKRGFTMIEIVVVFTVIAIISAVGVASFVTYSRTQTVNTAVSDVVTVLNKARSEAASQLRPQILGCQNNESINGYSVAICGSSDCNSYQFKVRCGGQDYLIEDRKLSSSVIFLSPLGKTFFFPVLTGGSLDEDSIKIKGYDMIRTINVYKDGRITIDN